MKFIDELRWRGMVHDVMPGLEELLDEEQVNFYHGIDPTADSIHVGHFVGVMAMRHFQKQGHRPFALIGGATGMIGDPSGKSEERNLLSEEVLRHNENCIKAQLERFLDFDGKSGARVVNNYDWFKDLGYLEFIRDIGKHITVSYMMAKDSVKSRLESGMSFTEFTYQLAQGYDFYHLYKAENCKLQIGGSDQWGNIVTGSELIRRKAGGSAFALTWPLVTKADGRKFGKTEKGNIWLDAKRTSAYKFYQFWFNSGDEEALKYLRLFTFMPPGEIEELETAHNAQPGRRLAQTKLAEDLTERVHSKEDLEQAIKASSILFGKSTKESLLGLDDNLFQDIFEGVPQFAVSKDSISGGVNLVDLLSDNNVLPSKGEVRRALKENSLALNSEKGLTMETTVGSDDLLNGKYLLVQRGKKNYYLIVAS